ncbi:cytochrome P450 [Talaromyces proteolyticus]|uniref:Cytochrome P450 n=1 Tax=Talaromyces proteolyticus TaxID=1131652 RepID=A0AAD4KLE6_9EURO|nr:cytochrome P450 [Talaromyces proteolyticus]KAH8690781.1 cytochrome P450 [Talaromyces proteolyticus]
MALQAIALLITLLGILFLYKIIRPSNPRIAPLPPGPKPKLFIGNLSDLPPAGEKEWLHWAKHKDLYGPISSIRLLTQTIIIINDMSLAFEILEKRSVIHSSRPRFVFANDLVGWDKALSSQNYTPLFRAYRKAVGRVMGSRKSVAQFDGLQEMESEKFLLRLLKQPENFKKHIRTEVVTAVLKMTYGYSVSDNDDPLLALADQALAEFSKAAMPGAWLVDIIPALKFIPEWMPGAGFKKTARAFRQTTLESTRVGLDFTKKEMATGKHIPSFTSNALEAGEDEEIVKWSSFALYGGGADTIISTLKCCFLALILNPEVQRRAQEEIDRVVGSERLPTAKDRDNLPYVDAIVKETLRWQPIAPLGLPHTADQDDVVEGFLIPKGAILLANIWLFNHDPSIYNDPSIFNPSRFMPTETYAAQPDPHNVTFGFGRRICPGRIFADTFLFLTIAQTLSVFSLSQPVDEDGKVLEQVVDFEPGIVTRPVDYKCNFTPRSPRHEQLIREIETEA